MKLTTTVALAVLVAAGALLFVLGGGGPIGPDPVAAPVDGPAAALAGWTVDAITRVAIRRGGTAVVTLDRRPGGWVVDGGWPANPAEVAALLDVLAGLRSRFAPVAVGDAEALDEHGLRPPALTVEVRLRDGGAARTHTLALGEPAGGDYRFVRPTYLRLDDGDEVLRVAPGLVERLGRPADLYRQRRLFPAERTVRRNNAQERIEQLAARAVSIEAKDATPLQLVRTDDGWELRQPTRDRLDPDAAERLLSAVADLWAEQFVPVDPTTGAVLFAAPDAPLGTATTAATLPALARRRAGLDTPERTLRVTRNDGTTTTLYLGASSRSDSPPPAPVSPRTPHPDSFRYARLDGSDLIFEISDNRLNDIFTTVDALRDARLARFNPDDARRVEVRQGPTAVVLVREKKDSWKMVAPRDTAADNDKVKELLTKLSGLEPAERDLFSPARRAARTAAAVAALAAPSLGDAVAAVTEVYADVTTGLDRPAAEIRVTVDEKARAEDRDRSRERTVAVRLSPSLGVSKKVFVQSEGWPRVDATDDSLAALVDRPTLAYRGKAPLEFTARDVQRVDVAWSGLLPLAGITGLVTGHDLPGRLAGVAALTRGVDPHLALVRQGDDWTLTDPVATAADAARVNELLDAIGRFKVLAFVADDVPADRLQADHGLQIPALTVRLTFADGRPPRTLSVGRRRDGEPGSFARLDGDPAVFVLPADLRDQLDRAPLAYLPATLWQLAAGDEVVRFRIAKRGQDEYELTRKGDGWQVSGPFTVAAPASVVERLIAAVQAPRAEEHRAFAAADPAAFGLDRPAVTLTLTTRSGQTHTLHVGAATTTGKPGRFARHDGKPAVLVVGDALATAADQSALDFLDRTLLRFDAQTVTGVTRRHGTDTLQLTKEDDTWRLVQPTEGPADDRKVPALLRQLGELSAERIVAYRPKELASFGLAPAEATLTVRRDDNGKTSNVILLIGKDDGSGGRFAQVQGGATVGVLSAAVVRHLLAGPLAFRDHLLARVPDADALRLEAGERKATFGRPEGTWKLTAPVAAEADHDALEAFANALARFRADELVAEAPAPAQLRAFGFDRPAARWQVLSGDETKLDFTVGGLEPFGKRRYAYLPEKKLVVLLDDRLSEQAAAEYRPRTVWKQPVDPAQVEAVRFGFAKESFEIRKVGGDWQVVGKPDVRLDQATVSDTLAALRDLKLQRYVRDAGAQLKLYGLDPAELALAVTTPTGTVTLHLGGLEGDTRQRYARVPIAGRSDVFLLDETASGKLFRDLPALTRPLGGPAGR